jgi:hypothetical protein
MQKYCATDARECDSPICVFGPFPASERGAVPDLPLDVGALRQPSDAR